MIIQPAKLGVLSRGRYGKRVVFQPWDHPPIEKTPWRSMDLQEISHVPARKLGRKLENWMFFLNG